MLSKIWWSHCFFTMINKASRVAKSRIIYRFFQLFNIILIFNILRFHYDNIVSRKVYYNRTNSIVVVTLSLFSGTLNVDKRFLGSIFRPIQYHSHKRRVSDSPIWNTNKTRMTLTPIRMDQANINVIRFYLGIFTRLADRLAFR